MEVHLWFTGEVTVICWRANTQSAFQFCQTNTQNGGQVQGGALKPMFHPWSDATVRHQSFEEIKTQKRTENTVGRRHS